MTRQLFSDDAIERAADALVREQSGGLCRLAKVCDICDCFAAHDPAVLNDRDTYARSHVRTVIAALTKGKE